MKDKWEEIIIISKNVKFEICCFVIKTYRKFHIEKKKEILCHVAFAIIITLIKNFYFDNLIVIII